MNVSTISPFFILFLVFSQIVSAQQSKVSNFDQYKIETVFSMPGFHGGTSLTIENRIIDLLRQSDSSTQVNMSLYTFGRVPLAMEILKASHRGVNIEIVIDDKEKDEVNQKGTALNLLVNGAPDLPGLRCDQEKCITFCKNSCQGLHINHNKFILFSHLNSHPSDPQNSQFVVAQSSANMTNGQLNNYNDLVIIKNDKKLYDGMMNYWKELKSDKFKLKKTPTIEGNSGVKAYFFPRLLNSDPVLNQLNEVVCTAPGSTIRIIQSRFDDYRVDVASRLFDLIQEGCDVKVIVRDEPDMQSPGVSVGHHLRTDLIVLPYKGKGLNPKNSIHSKVILIHAKTRNSKDKITLVMTGSHNLNFSSLKTNDEVLLKIKDETVYRSYLKYWNQLYEDSRVLFKPAVN